MGSRRAAVHLACLGMKMSETMPCAEKWLGMIPHLPPHSPSDPSRQNTSTYLQKRRDKKINDRTLNYITTYWASAPFVSSGGDRTPLYIYTMYAAPYWNLHFEAE